MLSHALSFLFFSFIFFFFLSFFFLFFFFVGCSKSDFSGSQFVTISVDSSYVKNHFFLGPSQGVLLCTLVSFFSSCFFSFFFIFSSFSLHSLFIRSSCSLHVLFMSSLCPLHVLFMLSSCSLHVLFIFSSFSRHCLFVSLRFLFDFSTFLFVFSSFSLRFLFVFSSVSLRFLFMFSSCSLHVLFIFSSFSLHFLFIFSSFSFIFFHFLSFSFCVGCSKSDFSGVSISLRFLVTPVLMWKKDFSGPSRRVQKKNRCSSFFAILLVFHFPFFLHFSFCFFHSRFFWLQRVAACSSVFTRALFHNVMGNMAGGTSSSAWNFSLQALLWP